MIEPVDLMIFKLQQKHLKIQQTMLNTHRSMQILELGRGLVLQQQKTKQENNWWGETNPNYDQDKGLFGGLTAPAGVDHFFDFSENTAFNNAQTTGSLKYTQALGSFSLKECQVGDLVLARFDLNIMPMVTNTTVEVGLIYSNRDPSDNVTFTFPLTITPFTYGNGTVGRGYLLRPTITHIWQTNRM